MRTRLLLFLIAFLFLFVSCGDDDPMDPVLVCEDEVGELTMNQIQVIGSHNSYRITPGTHIFLLLQGAADQLPEDFDPAEWDYTHAPLVEQFDDYGVRSVEIDIYRDPDGGRFYFRGGDAIAGFDPDSGEPALQDPGLKVLHFPDFDYLTHHLTFKDALQTIKQWSLDNPTHLPISILLEAKEDSPNDLLPGLGLTTALPFDNEGLDEIDEEITEVFFEGLDQVITPDEIQGNHTNLKNAVVAGEWLTLDESRGKILFILLGPDDVLERYNDRNSDDKILFVFNDEDHENAAFLKVDDPIANFDFIKQKVEEGFIVRTRADADTKEAREGNYNRLMMAINSGAQIISTDYYTADRRAMTQMGWTDYEASFESDELAIFNTVNGPADLSMQCIVSE